MHDKVYCIIVLYNAMQWVDKCLSSLEVSEIPVSIVCVDNGSKDDTCAFIQEHYPDVKLIRNKNNKGFGQANNQGIEYSYKQGGTHFFLLNQDAYVFPTTIKSLIAAQNKYDLGLVSPIHLNGDASLLDHNFFDSLVVSPKNNLFVHDLLLCKTKPYYVPEYTPCAAAWLLSRRCIETIGGFDPLFFHYGEDANYFQRANYHKIGVGVVPEAFICHDREYHGNIDVYNKRKVLTNLLITYADVNVNRKAQKAKKQRLHFFFFKLFLRYMFSFRLTKAFQIIGGYKHCLNRHKQIKNSIRVNRNVGPAWLSLR